MQSLIVGEMSDIWIPELIILIFLLLSFLRFFFKGLRFLDGILWLPLISFVLLVCLFPAYGFRLECIPLLVFSFITFVISIPRLVQSKDSDDIGHGVSFVPTIIGLIFLIITVIPLFIFAPKIPLILQTESVENRMIHDKSAGNNYFLRIYRPSIGENEQKPIILLAPPEAGSVYACDRVCSELRDQGFFVVTYSRHGLDSPCAGAGRKHHVSAVKISRMWQAFRKGTEKKKANDWGQYLEAERQKDMEFLLPLICRNLDENGTTLISGLRSGRPELPVFLAGYGAAGSAAVFLFEQPGFSARHANVLGIAAIECWLWQSYLEDVSSRRLEPRWLPQPEIPVLYLVSDRALDLTNQQVLKKQNPYRAILDTFNNSRRHSVLAAFEGAGPFAYNDFSLTHPLYTVLFPGQIKKKPKINLADAAGYIGNYFISLLEKNADAEPAEFYERAGAELLIPEKRVISARVIEE